MCKYAKNIMFKDKRNIFLLHKSKENWYILVFAWNGISLNNVRQFKEYLSVSANL